MRPAVAKHAVGDLEDFMPDQNGQRIPRSIGMTLRVIRARAGLGGMTRDKLAVALNVLPGRFRDHTADVGTRVLERAEHCQRLYYYVLRLYAGLIGVPAGMIYLLAATAAHLRDNDVRRVRRTAKMLRRFADYIETNAAALTRLPPVSLAGRQQETEQQARARSVVLDYVRTTELPDGKTVPYTGSAQQHDDARLAFIIDALLTHLTEGARRTDPDPDQDD